MLRILGKNLSKRIAFIKPCRSLLHTTSILKDSDMNDPIEHATGIEKRELLAIAAGDSDPFMLDTMLERGPGTKECPNLVPSAFDGRLVGCMCQGNRFAQWMWLEKGCPKRCECGFWFELKEVEPF